MRTFYVSGNVKSAKRQILVALALAAVFGSLFVLYVRRTEKLAACPASGFFPRKDTIECYRLNKSEQTLADISDLEIPPGENSIFFHETSCRSHRHGKIVITGRQACAVESAARLNPRRQVFLLYSSPGVLKLEEGTESDGFLSALLRFENVRILHVNLEKYSNDTPLAALYESGALDASNFPQPHASDLLRFLTLWKYGGTYLDLDVIVVKPLEKLGANYAGLESRVHVGSAILNFGKDALGRRMAIRCLNDLELNFDGEEWGNNGPEVITRVLKNVCKVHLPANMVNRHCQGFTVHPPEAFFAITWDKWWMYFHRNCVEFVRNKTKDSYVLHIWNKHSAKPKLAKAKKTAYMEFAAEFCPTVYGQVFDYF